VLVLGGALLMLVAGQSVLQGKLAGALYVGYWLLCLVLTGVAVVVAFADVRATSHEIRRQERELLEHTIKQIEAESRNQPGKTKS
jgi:hypothetical protein